MASMEEQVKLLVALQDLDLMMKEVNDADTSSEMKQMGFKLDGMAELHKARANLAETHPSPAPQSLRKALEILRTSRGPRDGKPLPRVLRHSSDVVPLAQTERLLPDLSELRKNIILPVIRKTALCPLARAADSV